MPAERERGGKSEKANVPYRRDGRRGGDIIDDDNDSAREERENERRMSVEPRPNMICSGGDGSLREMEEEMAGGTNKHGDFSSSFFRTPVRLDQQRRPRRVVSSLPLVFSCRPRSQIARSPPGLRNPFVRPSVRPAGYRRPLSLGESVRDTMANDGRRMEGGSTGLHHSAVKPSQPANPKIVVFECVGAKSGGSSGGRVAPREQI